VESIEGTDHITLIGTLSPLLFFKGSTTKPIDQFMRKLHQKNNLSAANPEQG
jgi:hypothetical protein